MLRIRHLSTCTLAAIFLLPPAALAAAKVHVIALGKWTTVRWFPAADGAPVTLKVRPLVVDGRVREQTVGPSHDITDRLFAVRRAFRLNDSLAGEPGEPRWQWQPGGWLLVDRLTGRISAINLPEFDVTTSQTSWYRDYAAYCGISDDGKKLYALVVQIGRRKPVLKDVLRKDVLQKEGSHGEPTDSSVCPAPVWQRSPARVSFEPASGARQTFAIRGHVVDLVNDGDDEEEEGSR